jgi:uncharacterized membrane protein
MRARSRMLPASIAVTVGAAAGIVVATGPAVARVPAGLLLGLLVPGVAAAYLLVPQSETGHTRRLALAPVLSLAVLVLGGLGLYALGIPLTRASWVALTVVVTFLLAVAALVRARLTPARNWAVSDTMHLGAVPARDALGQRPGRRLALRLAPLVLAAAILAGSGYFAWHDATRHDAATPFSELALVPAGPEKPTGTTWPVVIGVFNHERSAVKYDVRVSGPGNFTAEFTPTVVGGSSWAKTLDVPTAGKVTVGLFRPGDKDPYRTVWISGVSR